MKNIKVVCFGGGTGLSSLLSGLKHNPWFDITAIVSMFDNGGSSGKLRDKFGILPPSDIMRCVLALSEDDTSARKLLLKRIHHQKVDGHTGGNLLLLALEQVYGDYIEAVDALGQILSAGGRVLPVSIAKSSLSAEYSDGTASVGEAQVDINIAAGKGIKRLFLEPAVAALPAALEAVQAADVLCVGPGNIFTSVVPNFLPMGMKEIFSATRAPVIFIANLLTEGVATNDGTVADQVNLVQEYLGRPVNVVLANDKMPEAKVLAKYAGFGKRPAELNELTGAESVTAELWQDGEIARHDPVRLSYALCHIISRLEVGR